MTEHVHEWLPTQNRATLPTEFFGWCECDETISLRELCKRANATERLSAEDIRKMIIISDDDWVKATLRAYADIREEELR